MGASTLSAAVELAHSPSGFSASLDFPGASLCVTYPLYLRDEACAGFNAPLPATQAKGVSIGMGSIRYPGFSVSFAVLAWPASKTGPMEEKKAAEFLKGYLEDAQRSSNASAVSQLEAGIKTVQGRPVYRYHGDLEFQGGHHVRDVVYYFSGQDYRYSLFFMTKLDHDQELQETADKFMDKVKVPPPTGSDEAERSYQLRNKAAKIAGLVILGVLLASLAALLAVLVWKAFFKKPPPHSPAPS